MTGMKGFRHIRPPELGDYSISERYWYDTGMLIGMVTMCNALFRFFFIYVVISILVLPIQYFVCGTFMPSYTLGGLTVSGLCVILLNFIRIQESREIIEESATEACTDDL